MVLSSLFVLDLLQSTRSSSVQTQFANWIQLAWLLCQPGSVQLEITKKGTIYIKHRWSQLRLSTLSRRSPSNAHRNHSWNRWKILRAKHPGDSVVRVNRVALRAVLLEVPGKTGIHFSGCNSVNQLINAIKCSSQLFDFDFLGGWLLSLLDTTGWKLEVIWNIIKCLAFNSFPIIKKTHIETSSTIRLWSLRASQLLNPKKNPFLEGSYKSRAT